MMTVMTAERDWAFINEVAPFKITANNFELDVLDSINTAYLDIYVVYQPSTELDNFCMKQYSDF